MQVFGHSEALHIAVMLHDLAVLAEYKPWSILLLGIQFLGLNCFKANKQEEQRTI
jgi:hypothetical protein